MTAFIVFDKIKDNTLKMSDTFVVSDKAWKMGGSRSFLELNSNVSIKDLLMGLIVQSGNDAAVVLAEGISGDEDAFAREMNNYAKLIGMHNTYFTNSSGWPHPNLQTTSKDLVLLTKKIIEEFPDLYKLFKEKVFTYNEIKQFNRNPLLYNMSGADGLKTGHTIESGYGLIGSVKRGNRRITIVLNGLKSLVKADVWLGQEPQVDLIAEKPFKKIISPLEYNKTKITIEWMNPLPAPIAKGDILGSIYISIPNQKLIKENLISTKRIDKMSSFLKVQSIIKYLLYGEIVDK